MKILIQIDANGPDAKACAAAVLRATADLLDLAPKRSPTEPERPTLMTHVPGLADELEEADAARTRLESLASSHGVPVARLIDEAQVWIEHHGRGRPGDVRTSIAGGDHV